MSVHGFNHDKCAQRNRVAAARFGVDAVPLKFLGNSTAAVSDDFLVLSSQGSLPDTPEAALKLINAKLPEGADPLAADDIFVHFYEAANSNYVGDRYLFLHESTLKNIAADGETGVSFMNSHRTGGLSEPTELPFGQTFCGQYQEGFDSQGNASRRSILGVVLRKGIHPNGTAGPSTDDLDKMARSGQFKDVSVGISGGEPFCDICGNQLNARDPETRDYLCPHYPGTHENMTAEQIASQTQRDARNSKGVATYSLHNARLNELSAVYDGAVPGAGVRKVMSFARTADLTQDNVRAFLREAFDTYGDLLPFDLGEIVEIKPESHTHPNPGGKTMAQPATKKLSLLEHIAAKLGIAPEGDEPAEEETPAAEPPADTPPAPEPAAQPEGDPAQPAEPEDTAALKAELAALRTRLSTTDQALQIRQVEESKARREAFEKSLVGRIPLASRPQLLSLYDACGEDGQKLALLKEFVDNTPPHPRFGDEPKTQLSEVEPPATGDKAKRRKELLSVTETGRQVLAAEAAKS